MAWGEEERISRVGSGGSDPTYRARARDERGGEGVDAFSGVYFAHVGDDAGGEDADEGAAGCYGGERSFFDGGGRGSGVEDEGMVGLGELECLGGHDGCGVDI